jgi:pimeloyl-ACP methyl ester carboxylesterase
MYYFPKDSCQDLTEKFFSFMMTVGKKTLQSLIQVGYKHHMNNHTKRIMGRSSYLQANASQFIKTRHFLIHYLHAGPGKPIILIHGGGMWLYSFRHNLKSLSGISSVHALDMPGYGYTSITDPSLLMRTDIMSLALKEFMDDLHISKATLVGHSWGGGWALAYALAFPERVNSIVLINSSGLNVPDVFEWELLKIPIVGSLLLRFLTPGMIKKRLELSFFKKGIVDDAMALEVHLPMRLPANRSAQALLARNLSWADVERHLGEIEHKVLLIWGEQDRYLDVGRVSRFKENIRNLKVEIIRDCGHSAHEEEPEIVNRLIMEFLVS